MRLIPTSAMLLCLAVSIPAICQQTSDSNSAATASANSAASSTPDHAALRSGLAQQNKLLQDQVEQQRAIVKMNEDLIKETQKLDDATKRFEDEKAKVAALSSELEKRREALKSAQKIGGSTSDPSQTVAQNSSSN
jgi:septal ring factor EnvC (AmiA/AmiB activator)